MIGTLGQWDDERLGREPNVAAVMGASGRSPTIVIRDETVDRITQSQRARQVQCVEAAH